jgi:hypothetical protein
MGSLVRAQAEERKKKAAYAAFFDVAFFVRALPIAIGRGAERNGYLIGAEKAIYDSPF